MPVHTVSVLAAQYKGRATPRDTTRTHALEDTGAATLCGRIPSSSTTESPDPHARPTCPTCLKRDPRSREGAPFILASLLQF